MLCVELVQRVCAAYAWQRALGHETSNERLCTVVRDVVRPQLWAANHVSQVHAHTRDEIDEVMQRAQRALSHCSHRLFLVDPFTPPAFVARLLLDDYGELAPTIQLVLEGELRIEPRAIDIREVNGEQDWLSIQALVGEDHSEGAQKHERSLPFEVTQAMVESYRMKAPTCQFFIARVGHVDCAHGAGVLCQGGIGMIEDLFTLPPYRRRGIATAVIARAVAFLRARGASTIVIGAHAGQRPKRLYAALGFAPVCVTREYIRHAAG
jgi:GNAT superfamily N-acetyltransferase